MKFLATRYWPFSVIFFVWFVFGASYFFKGQIPFPSTHLVTFFSPWAQTYVGPVKNNAMPDVITQIYPWKRVTLESWRGAQIPLWNPYSFAGTKHAGNYQSAVFSPVNLLFFILPEVDAWSVMILLQPLLAGIFMLLFLKSLNLPDAAGVFGSVAFMFCGFNVVWMAYGTLGYAVLYLPLILYGITSQKKWLVSISIALSFLSGHLQMSLYVLLFSVCYVVYKRQFFYLVSIVLGLLIAAPQLLLSFDAFMQSGRSTGIIRAEIIPWQYLVTVFAPDFFGNAVTRNDWFGHYAEWASFIGVAPLMFAAFAVFRKYQDRTVCFFATMGIVAILFATPSVLNWLIYFLHIPIFSNSAASRIIVLFSFSFSVLSAFGIAELSEYWNAKKAKKPWFFVIPVIFVWVWILGFHPFTDDKIQIALRNLIIPTGLFVVVAGLSSLGFFVSKRFRWILVCIIVLATFFDLLRFAIKWIPFESRELVYPTIPVIEKITDLTRDNHSRIFANMGNELGSSFGLQMIEGYDALYQKRYGSFISSITTGQPNNLSRSVVSFDKHGTYAERILQMLGVRYYVHKKSDGRFPWAYPVWEYPHYSLIWEDDNFQIFENTKSLPRVFLSSSYEVQANDEQILRAVFEAQQEIVLEKNPVPLPEPGYGFADIISYSPNKIIIRSQSETPQLLFLSDVYDSGWRTKVDGKSTELLRANYNFRALALSAGSHEIVFSYIPVGFIFGMILCAFGTIGSVVVERKKKFV